MPGMPYKIKSIVTRKLEGVNHFHNYLCRQLKGSGMEINMADTKTPEERSKNMSHIRSTNTKPEELVRKFLFAQGFRYRKNDKRYPGKPDIVLPKYHTVIFVNGCFWHMHDCSRARLPRSNQEYWEPKIKRNAERDQENTRKLKEAGWKVIVVWECELKGRVAEDKLWRLCEEIQS